MGPTNHKNLLTMIALLRGINVGGHNVSMERLRALFTELGFESVRSYIQTGNIFFDTSETDKHKLRERIETHLKSVLGYDVPVFLRTIEEFAAVIALNPFKDREITPDMRCCIMFTADRSSSQVKLPVTSPKGDLELIALTNSEAFVIWYLINGKAPSNMTFLDAFTGKSTTSRFYHTAEKILAAAKKES